MCQRLSAGVSPRIFDWGDESWRGDGFRWVKTTYPQNSDFSSDFTHFILDILEKPKVIANIPKISLKNHDFWGTSPWNFKTGNGTRPPHPPSPGDDAHACLYIAARNPYSLMSKVYPYLLSHTKIVLECRCEICFMGHLGLRCRWKHSFFYIRLNLTSKSGQDKAK